MEEDLLWKMTSKYKKVIGLYSNSNGMEDNLKISKVEYLSNRLLKHNQLLNLILDDQTILFKFSK
jgi:hypothetical protein